MADEAKRQIEGFWKLLETGDAAGLAALFAPDAFWDDPLYDRETGGAVAKTAIPRFAAWLRERRASGPIELLRVTAEGKRVAVECVVPIKDAMVWDQAAGKSGRAARVELATAFVAELAPGGAALASLRLYFSTWVVLDGKSRLRVGPVCPVEREATERSLAEVPELHRYFDCLAKGDAAIVGCFEPDGYFREPANNFACGREQLASHFTGILKLGGVGIDHLTATRAGGCVALELQTVVWGTKRMPAPQAGFASYDIGPHGKVQGARVYDSVVPPEL